jgi:class 3 adenylate cyclase
MRLSIGGKIFGVVLFLVALIVAVAITTVRLSNKVVDQLEDVGAHYLPPISALADAQRGNLEQENLVRQLVEAALLHDGDDVEIRLRNDIEETKRGVLENLAIARHWLAEHMADDVEFGDRYGLSRVDTRLELLQEDTGHLSEARALIYSLLNRPESDEFRRAVGEWRQRRVAFDRRLDQARQEMQRLTHGSIAETRRHQVAVSEATLAVAALASLFGLMVAGMAARTLARPVRLLLEATRQVESGKLDLVIPRTSGDEIGDLTDAFNRMVRELEVKARIRDTFGKYIDPRIVEGLIHRPDLAAPGGERRVMTVFFSDLVGFTNLSEGVTPTALVNIINRYLTVMSEPIRSNGGVIDKYIGDAIMAYWGAPFVATDEQATRACLAAIEQMTRVHSFNHELPELMGIKRNVPDIGMRIGIASGDLVVGNIGSDVTTSYTVMGDTVNFASRLEGANKGYGTRMLASEATARMAEGTIEFREIDLILVVGKTEPERIFEILGHKGEIAPAVAALRERFAEGLDAYRRGSWDLAESAFKGALELASNDGPSAVFLERLTRLRQEPPPGDWNGVWALKEK